MQQNNKNLDLQNFFKFGISYSNYKEMFKEIKIRDYIPIPNMNMFCDWPSEKKV